MSEQELKPKRKKTHTWSSIYLNAIARGFDEGYAAFLAYKWENEQAKRRAKQEKEG